MARVLPVLGAAFAALFAITGGSAEADPQGTAGTMQGPDLAATRAMARAVNRDAGDRAPTVGETYPDGTTHSPLTPRVVAHLRELAQHGDLHPNVFSKIGASATVNRNFLRCFSGPHVNLAGREHLRETLEAFDAGRPNPFLRESESATVGWHAGRAVWGEHPPLAREVRAADPRFAVVMYGTNDIELNRPLLYAELMTRLVRMLEIRGVIPILTTIMPRDDDPEADRVVDLYNAVVRGVAQQRRVPLIDYHRELAALPDHGLASDRLHPNVHFVDGEPRGCDFGEEGLRHGYNVRNLITLEALHRVRAVVLEGDDPPDEPAPPPAGAGTLGDPVEMGTLPFAHASDTTRAPRRLFDRYPACGATQDESGPELVYHLHLDEPAEVRAMVVDEGAVDVDLHLLTLDAGGARCVERADAELALTLDAGDHYFAVDTFVDHRGDEHAGEYLFVAARTDRPSD